MPDLAFLATVRPMSMTLTLRRPAIAVAAGALVLGVGLASSPASAQQRAFANPLVTATTTDPDVASLAVDANATSVSVRLRVENMPTAYKLLTSFASQAKAPHEHYVSVLTQYSGATVKVSGSRTDGTQTVTLPKEALHVTVTGTEIQVTVDQPHVGWAGPYYAAGLLVIDSLVKPVAAAATPTDSTKTSFDLTGFGPVSSAQDATSTQLTVSRPTGTTPGKLTATVTPGLPGAVAFYDGARSLSTVPVSNATATATLPRNLSAGTHSMRAVFTPTDTARYAASEASAALTVTASGTWTGTSVKGVAARLKLSAAVQHRGRKPVKATLTVTGARTGTAVVYDGTRKIKSTRFSGGKVVLTLPKKLRTGLHRIKAVVTTTAGGARSTTSSNTVSLKVSAH